MDVPCSGDGAIRKLPNRWRLWNSKDGQELHSIQIELLQRAIQLTKEGGVIVYSTCSLNPIENEAVITEVLNRAKKYSPDPENSLEIVNIHDQLSGLKSRKGLHYWDVLKMKKNGPHSYNTKLSETSTEQLFHIYSGTGRDSELTILKNGEQIDGKKEQLPQIITESMFPLKKEEMEASNIHYSMRIMPHDQDTGGFFVAKFIKKGQVMFSFLEQLEAQWKSAKKPKKDIVKEYMKFEELDPEGCNRIFEYYGLDDVTLSFIFMIFF